MRRDVHGAVPPAAFDADLYGAICLTTAFSSPWVGVERLKMGNRCALWVLGVGRIVEHTAGSRAEVEELMGEILAVADGGPPRAAVTRFLADLRDELDTVAGFRAVRGTWRDQLARMLAAMARAWSWRDAGAVPSLERYLDNADACGSSFVDLSHWIYAGDAWARRNLAELRAASEQVQRYLHLLGDLASYRRDVSWGDLNVLDLGVTHAEVAGRMAELAREAGELIARCASTARRPPPTSVAKSDSTPVFRTFPAYGPKGRP